MKSVRYFWIGILFLFCSACERDLMSYEGTESVYFAVQSGNSWGGENDWPYSPYTDVEFVKITTDTTTVLVKVAITGPLKDYPRPFHIEINTDSTKAQAGIHYEPLPAECVIAAHTHYTYVPVKLHRLPDMRKNAVTIGLKLIANDYFTLVFPEWGQPLGHTNSSVIYEGFDVSLHTIRITDFLVQPSEWAGSVNAEGKESGMMGAFTERKFNLICDLFDLTYMDFMSKEIMTYMQQLLISQRLSKELMKRKQENKPELEEDGRLMWIDGCPWESFIGVPWVPDNN